jgi:hypothetical protein
MKDEQYYKSLDKRTKEYKEWRKNFEKENSIGLGDVVEKAIKITGLDNFVNGQDCGCDKRKQKLNKIRLRFSAVRCFDEEHFLKWTEYIESKENKQKTMTAAQQREILFPVYRHLFARNILSDKHIRKGKILNCCIDGYVNEINKIYQAY